MCLYTNDATVKTAVKDITCYKIMFYDDKQFESIYYSKKYEINEVVTDDDVDTLTVQTAHNSYYKLLGLMWTKYAVFKGFHTYNNLNNTLTLLRYVRNSRVEFDSNDLVVVKCIIPKGAHYMTGNHYTVGDSPLYESGYVSDKLIVTGEICNILNK